MNIRALAFLIVLPVWLVISLQPAFSQSSRFPLQGGGGQDEVNQV